MSKSNVSVLENACFLHARLVKAGSCDGSTVLSYAESLNLVIDPPEQALACFKLTKGRVAHLTLQKQEGGKENQKH